MPVWGCIILRVGMVDLHPIGQLASCFQYQYFLSNNLGKSGRTNDIIYDLIHSSNYGTQLASRLFSVCVQAAEFRENPNNPPTYFTSMSLHFLLIEQIKTPSSE